MENSLKKVDRNNNTNNCNKKLSKKKFSTKTKNMISFPIIFVKEILRENNKNQNNNNLVYNVYVSIEIN